MNKNDIFFRDSLHLQNAFLDASPNWGLNIYQNLAHLYTFQYPSGTRYSKNRNKRGNFHNKRDKIGACFDVPKKLDCSRKILQKKTTFWYHKLPRLF